MTRDEIECVMGWLAEKESRIRKLESYSIEQLAKEYEAWYRESQQAALIAKMK